MKKGRDNGGKEGLRKETKEQIVEKRRDNRETSEENGAKEGSAGGGEIGITERGRGK